MSEQWTVISEPVSDNDGPNRSGMSVALRQGDRVEELGAVAWIRKDSANPKKKMGDVLQEKVAEAQKVADELNRIEDDKMRQAKESFEPVREQLRAEMEAAGELLLKLSGLDFDQIADQRDAIDTLAKLDLSSVEAAVEKLQPLRKQIEAELKTVTAALDEIRRIDLFRLEKARLVVEQLHDLEITKLDERKAAVEPLADRLEAERDAAQAALDEYDEAVEQKLVELRPDSTKPW